MFEISILLTVYQLSNTLKKKRMFMRKKVSLICLFLLVSSLYAKAKNLEPVQFERVETNYEKYTIRTEPTVEALLVVCNLAELPGVYPNQYDKSEYYEAVQSFFAKQKNHDTVKLVKNLAIKNKLYISDFIGIASIMNQDFTGWIQEPELDDLYVTKAWKKGNPQKLLEALNQFVHDSKFDKFYLLHRPEYLKMQRGFIEVLENHGEEFISELYFNGESKNICINATIMASNVIYPFGPLKNDSPWDYMFVESPVYSKNQYANFIHYTSYSILANKIKEADSNLLKEFYELRKKLNEMKGLSNQPEELMNKELAFQISDMHRLYALFKYSSEEEIEAFESVVKNNYGADIVDSMKTLYEDYFSKIPAERDYIRDLSSTEISQNIVLYKKQIEAYQK